MLVHIVIIVTVFAITMSKKKEEEKKTKGLTEKYDLNLESV